MVKFIIFIITALVSWSIQAQDPLIARADSLYNFGKYAQAIETYKDVKPQSDIYEKMAKSYVALGNYDAALEAYKNALKSFPENALLKYDYAKLLSRSKKLKDAAVLLNELVNQDYKNPNYHYELGLVLERQGDSSAINRFHTTFDLDKSHQKAIQKIARNYLVRRNYKASLRYIDIGLETYENNLELINLKALNYYWMEKYQEAALWFKKLLELGENSLFIQEKLSFCLAQQQKYEQAIFHAKIAVDMDPKKASNLYILGQLYDEIEDYVSAEEWLRKALILMDQSLNTEYSQLATVLNQQKKYKEAIDALQIAIRENPNDETAQFFLVKTKDAYYADQNSKIKAYESFNEKFPKSIYTSYIKLRLKELRDEKFMSAE